jgi:hypothetical protein
VGVPGARTDGPGTPVALPAAVRQRIAAVALGVSCALASCVQGPETQETDRGETQRSQEPEPSGEARQEVYDTDGRRYESKDFPFVVEVKDDGKDEGGGWQVCGTILHFRQGHWWWFVEHDVYRWQCRVKIGMPLRTKRTGRISPSFASLASAEIANEVVPALLEQDDWRGKPAVFCKELRDAMDAMFDRQHEGLGAKVQVNQ